MVDGPRDGFGADGPAPWLEVLDGCSPILLIAPHGGRAGPASRLRPNPKVNDLHTAQMTRTLAGTLSASALINAAMDRNQLDCNRLGQLLEGAPWLLEMIARRVEAIITNHRRAIVLVIHGWNIIEPRVDFGVGARLRDGSLVPAGNAHISASDEFINRTVADLADRLRSDGIVPSFGHRYPAGGFHNLLQAFTPRHLESPYASLRRLATLAAQGAIDALQVELSVAVRMPGALRERALETIGAAFTGERGAAPASPTAIPVIRTVKARSRVAAARVERIGPPARVGLEFFDAAAGVGVMASFDLGHGAIGARIMILLEGRRVALFTSEGIAQREPGRIALGPLALHTDASGVELRFTGPVVLVPDGIAYLSIERALASGVLDEAAQLSARFSFKGTPLDLQQLLVEGVGSASTSDWNAAFGELEGTLLIAGAASKLHAVGRVGLSFAGLGPAAFRSRRMVWACFPENSSPTALEARVISQDGGVLHSQGRALGKKGWASCEIAGFELETPSLDAPPEEISAAVAIGDGKSIRLSGQVRNFVPLSRPGPNQSRIYTTLGFANFRLGHHEGAGMFEYSRRSDSATSKAQSGDSDD